MGNIPVLKPGEVITILLQLGFVEVLQRGSHKPPVLLRQIVKDIGLTLDEFLSNQK